MAYTTVNNGSLFMNPTLYTGNSTATAHTVGFQPDFTWLKVRNATGAHYLFDSVRLATNYIQSNSNALQGTDAQTLKSFDANGYTVGTSNSVNTNGETMVGWNWKAGGGQGSSNTDGSINTTYTSVNTTSGFSISSYTGTGSNATVGHGLGAVPKMIIVKETIGSANDWTVYHVTQGSNTRGILNETNAWGSNTAWNNTTPTSSVFSIGSGSVTNRSGSTYTAYCFSDIQGFSKMGSYVGNGNVDGTFIYTGFKPSFIMYKKSSGTGRWTMEDNKRDPINVATRGLEANNSTAENTGSGYWDVDLLSNGFKFRTTEQETNQSGQTFIYMAFAEAPLVGSNNVPCTAR